MKNIMLITLLTALQAVFSSGIIKGTVVSSENTILTEANIIVIGTTLGSATDETGKFVIRGIKEGRYLLRCSHIGYTDDFARGVLVQKDSVSVIDFVLEPTEYQMQAIEVEKKMDDIDAIMKTRNLGTSEFFTVQNVEKPVIKGKIRVDTSVGFWARFRLFFYKMFN